MGKNQEYKYPLCSWCGEVMHNGPGCTYTSIRYEGVQYKRLRYGQEHLRVSFDADEQPSTCRDCGTPLGEYHHPGCCVELLPAIPECMAVQALDLLAQDSLEFVR